MIGKNIRRPRISKFLPKPNKIKKPSLSGSNSSLRDNLIVVGGPRRTFKTRREARASYGLRKQLNGLRSKKISPVLKRNFSSPFLLSDIAEFARPRGAKDKKKRNSRVKNVLIGASLLGAGAGLGALAGRAYTSRAVKKAINNLDAVSSRERQFLDPRVLKDYDEQIDRGRKTIINYGKTAKRQGSAYGALIGTNVAATGIAGNYLINRKKKDRTR